MLEALFGASLFGRSTFVTLSISYSPFLRTVKKMTAKSAPYMQPRTDLRFCSPVFLGLYVEAPKLVANQLISII
jgi:hypothetical protein